MKLTPLERRSRIYALAEADPDYRAIKAEYDTAQRKFERLTNKLPRRLRNFLWQFPGAGYFVHHRMLNIICESMQFPDE